MKKIMFNDKHRFTEAVLSGRKTVTRRMIKRELDINDFPYMELKFRPCQPPYQVGEIVAVAQSYECIGCNPSSRLWDKDMVGYYTRADAAPGWNNKMFVMAHLMPHQIQILDIRPERLQEITDEDCMMEGIQFVEEIGKYYFERNGRDEGFYFNTPREAFAALIDKISGRGTWNKNPFVWRIEFKQVK